MVIRLRVYDLVYKEYVIARDFDLVADTGLPGDEGLYSHIVGISPMEDRFQIERDTGLVDCEGKHIFENDVVIDVEALSDPDSLSKSHKVVWDDESCGWFPFVNGCKHALIPDKVKVIGARH